MKNTINLLRAIFTTIIKYRTLIPKGFVIIFTIISAIVTAFKEGTRQGIEVLVKTILASELVIRRNVDLALAADPTFSFFAFLQILNALFIIYILTKFIAEYIIIGVAGGQAKVMAYILALIALGLVEMAAIGWTEGEFFLPIWDGVIYLFLNIQPVWQNINWTSFATPSQPAMEQVLNVTMDNSTSLGNLTNSTIQ